MPYTCQPLLGAAHKDEVGMGRGGGGLGGGGVGSTLTLTYLGGTHDIKVNVC